MRRMMITSSRVPAVLCLALAVMFSAALARRSLASDAASPVRVFSITDFGAVGDGKTMNSDAFQKAIQACSAAGGGRVTVPAGTFLTGPIQLLSYIDLHLERGAT